MIAFNWALVHYDGRWLRMNGQHSSPAIVDFEEVFKRSLPDSLTFHVDSFEADTKEGMADLFQQYDPKWSSRSKADIAGAYQCLNADLAKCDRAKAKLAVEGVIWFRRRVEDIPVPGGDHQYQIFFNEALHPFVCEVDNILTVKTPELKDKPVLAAMYATHEQSESAFREFWRRVAEPDSTNPTHSTSVLSADLVADLTLKTGTPADQKNDKPMSPGEMYAKCILAWNVFRKDPNGTVGALKWNSKKGFPKVAE